MKIYKIAIVGMLFISLGLSAQKHTKNQNRIMADAEKAKTQFMAKDAGVENFFNGSDAYVIFPNIGKGGLIVGAAAGNGVVYENGTVIGMASVKKLDVGLQAGGKTFSEVIFFQDKESFMRFKNDDFEFTGNVSAVMLKSGAAAEAKYRDGIAVFAMPKAGLMVDVSVGGQKFEYMPFN